MKRNILKNILTVILVLSACSCADQTWDEYYGKPEYVKDGSSFDLLTRNPDYTEFVGLLIKTGCDSILLRSDVHTVFAPKNGSFSDIDTTTNLEELRKTINMHILPSLVYKEKMGNSYKLSVSGKLLKFSTSGQNITVNGAKISSYDLKTSNGLIQGIDTVIVPKSNLYDVVMSDPDLTSFKAFIDSSYESIIDPVNNIKIGFDTLNKPVYQEPINYIVFSRFLEGLKVQNESKLYTGFFPSNQLVDEVVANLIVAKSGHSELIAPRLSTEHGDTVVAYRFFKKGLAYPGDTAVLLKNIFNHIMAQGAFPTLGGSMTSITGAPLSVTSDQVKVAAREVSNGYYYVLDKLTVPASFYRNEYFFRPDVKVTNPADPSGPTIFNPDIIYSGGAINTASNPVVVSKPIVCVTGKFTRFDLARVGGAIDLRFPFVTQGDYDVVLSCFPEANNGLVNVSYGSQVLIRDMETSNVYNGRAYVAVEKTVGTIHVAADGVVQIKITCSNSNIVTFPKYAFTLDYLALRPVTVP
ncbi:MAG: fasciclin domain-containing protein [Bacteroidales bacterium]|nr:fasciclin domain-containing protein [Bacteroidales bacterium]